MVLKYADLFCALHFFNRSAYTVGLLNLLHYGQFLLKSPPSVWLLSLWFDFLSFSLLSVAFVICASGWGSSWV